MLKKLLTNFEGKNDGPPPIWIMRQAGRYLPEYKKVRELAGSFLNLCYNPQKACEVTLQPIDRFNLDAAIIFSDILVIPHSLGLEVTFEAGEGPKVQRVTSYEDLKLLKVDPEEERLQKVYEAISLTRSRLPSDKALIGFVGAPWTVATYMLEGRGKHDFTLSRKIAYSEPKFLSDLIKIVTELTIHHLSGQIKAGADLVQIFDSWAGVLSGEEYDEFVIKPTIEIVKAIKKSHPNVKIIGFPRGSCYQYKRYANSTGVDGLGIDQSTPLAEAALWNRDLVIQGNLDPVVLLSNKEKIAQKVDEIIMTKPEKFIFNLGHGILPETPIENVEFLIEYVRGNVR